MRHLVLLLFLDIKSMPRYIHPVLLAEGRLPVVPLGGAGCGARASGLTSRASGGLGTTLHGHKNDPCARSSLNDSRQESKPGVARKRGPIGT